MTNSTALSPEAGQQGRRGRLSSLLGWLLDVAERWDIAWTIIAFNSAGFVVGTIFWYGGQLLGAADQWFLWPFIPDCPLFAGLFIIAFLGLRRRRDWHLFYTITAFGLVKYGVWTVVFSVAYWLGGAAVEPMSLAMCFTHVGMILEGVCVAYRIISPVTRIGDGEAPPPGRGRLGGGDVLSYSRSSLSPIPSSTGKGIAAGGFRQVDVLVAFAWFLLSDFVDYGLGHYPQFDPALVPMPLIQWHTIAMTFGLAALFLILSRRRRAAAQAGS